VDAPDHPARRRLVRHVPVQEAAAEQERGAQARLRQQQRVGQVGNALR
jgi:hypothetical protein